MVYLYLNAIIRMKYEMCLVRTLKTIFWENQNNFLGCIDTIIREYVCIQGIVFRFFFRSFFKFASLFSEKNASLSQSISRMFGETLKNRFVQNSI